MAPSVCVLLAILSLGAADAGQAPELVARSQAAAKAMESGRFDEAVRMYRELLAALPDEPGLLMNLGMALAMSGREGDAIAPLQRALALDPKLLPAQLFLGSSYLARGEPARAIEPLQRVVAARPSDVESRRMLAQAYSGAGRIADAVTELRRLAELSPKTPAAWYALGHAYNALAQEGMGTFETEPETSPWRRLLLADALAADGRFTDAFALYRETEAALPSMPVIHHEVARIYDATEHPDWAAAERRKAAVPPAQCARRKPLCEFLAGRHRAALSASLGATDREARYIRVRAATALALAAFERLDTLPDSRERREVRAALARNQRRYADAITELEAARAFAPRDRGLVDDLGTSYYQAREYEKALQTLMPLVTAGPDDARLLTVCGDSLLQLQRVDEAVPLLERAVRANGGDAVARLTLGRAYAQQGNHAAAVPLLESQVAQDADGSLHVQLARSYTALKQEQKAAAALERAQALQQRARERDAAQAKRSITAPK